MSNRSRTTTRTKDELPKLLRPGAPGCAKLTTSESTQGLRPWYPATRPSGIGVAAPVVVTRLATAFIALRGARGQRGRPGLGPSPSCCMRRRRISPAVMLASSASRLASTLTSAGCVEVSNAQASGPESGRTAAWPDCLRRRDRDPPRHQGAQEHVCATEEPPPFPLAPSKTINPGVCPLRTALALTRINRLLLVSRSVPSVVPFRA